MLFSIENIEDLENLNKLVSSENQVKTVRLQDKLGKQNFHEDVKKVFEPLTKSIENVSEEITKTIPEPSNNNNRTLANLNDKLLEIMNDRCIVASYFLSLLSKITNLENISQFNLLKDHKSNRVNDLLIHNTIPINLHDNLVIFSKEEIELKGDLMKWINIKNYNVDLASLSDKKLMYYFTKKMNFDVKGLGRKSTRDSTFMKLLKSPGLMVSASGV